jgi:hypothetical protein
MVLSEILEQIFSSIPTAQQERHPTKQKMPPIYRVEALERKNDPFARFYDEILLLYIVFLSNDPSLN